MLTRNLDLASGLCNRTRLIITSVSRNLITAAILTGEKKGERVLIPRIPMKTDDTHRLGIVFTRRHFPLMLSFAITINKSQGQSVPKLGLDLNRPAFTHGQLYVALSRATDPSNLRILLPASNDQKTKNVVFTDLLALARGSSNRVAARDDRGAAQNAISDSGFIEDVDMDCDSDAGMEEHV